MGESENVGGGFIKPFRISNHAYVGPIVPQKKLKKKSLLTTVY